MGGAIASAAKVASVALVGGLVVGVKGAIDAFGEAQKVAAQTNVTLKSTGGAAKVTAKEISDLATAISRKSGLDDEAIQSGENLLLTFTKIRNETGRGNDIFTRATQTVADFSVVFKKDLAGSAILVGKALNDPIKGTGALSRVGVQFTKTQKDSIATLIKHGKTLDAQKIILKELETQTKGAAAAYGDTLPGKIDKAKVAFGNLQEAVGGALAPAFGDAADAAANFITNLTTSDRPAAFFAGIKSRVSDVSDAITGLIDNFKGKRKGGDSLAEALGGTFADAVGSIDWGPIGEKISDGFSKGVDFTGKLAPAVASGIGTALGQVDGRKLLAGLLRVVSEAIDALFSPSFWRDNFAAIFSTVTIAIPVAKILKIPGAEFLFRHISKPFFGALSKLSKGLVSRFGNVAEDALTGFLGGLEKFAPRTARVLLGLVTGSGKWLSGLPGKFRGAGNRAIDGLVGVIGKGASAVAGAIGSLVGRVVKPFEQLASKAFAAGKAAIGALGRGLKSLVPHFDISLDPRHPHFRVTFGPGKQTGGLIPGAGRGDTVPAMLEPGEFVIQRKVVEKFGPTFFAGLNGGMGGRQGQGRVPGFTSGGIVSRANKMDAMDLPYLWGGGHGGGISRGVDCSGAVSWALGVSPRVSGAFMGFGKPGPGGPMDTKIYANPSHVFAVFNGRGWGTSHENPGGGPGWLSYNHRPGFTVRHLSDGGPSGGTGSGVGDSQERVEANKQQLQSNEDRIAALRGQLADVPGGKKGASRRKALQESIRTLTERNRLLRRSISNAPSAAEITAGQERAGSRLVNQIGAPFAKGFRLTSGRAAALGGEVEDAGTAFGQAERLFGQTEEDLGTAGGRKQRLGELTALARLKAKTLQRQKKRADALKKAIANRTSMLKKLRKARDKTHGAKRAKINERLRSYESSLDDLKAELHALGFAITDTELDIGDLAKEARDVAATPDTEVEAGPTVTDRVSDLLSLVDLKERAGTMGAPEAAAQRQAIIAAGIQGKFGATTEREQLQLMGDLKEAQQAGVQAVEDNTQAIRDLQKSIDDNTAFARSVMATENASLTRSIADLISGQIAGVGIAGRALMPSAAGAGRARY